MSFNPSPMRFGASNVSLIESILDSLKTAMGTAFDVQFGSITWIYLQAIARVFNDVYEQNKRFSYQWDPLRVTDFLARWEKIYGIVPTSSDTLVDRREKLAYKMGLVGQSPTAQVVQDLLVTLLNDVFVSIENIASADANCAIPGGATIPGGNTIPDGDWFSTTSYIPIKVIQPDYMDDLTFYETVAQIFAYLSDLMPAWVTFDWFRDSEVYGTGFYLDAEHNLDNQAFNP